MAEGGPQVIAAASTVRLRGTRYDKCSCGALKRTVAKMCRSCRADVVRTPISDRFWPRVDRRSANECWLWLGNSNGKYGIVFVRKVDGAPTWVYAHRLSWELEHGPIPTGSHIDHLCSQKLCVNPTHLEAVSPRENLRRYYERTPSNGTRARGPEPTHNAGGTK